MGKPPTPALRPVNLMVQSALGDLPKGFFNFGLYFNKWFYVVNQYNFPDKWKRPEPWTCTISDETKVSYRNDFCNPNTLLDNFAVSIALFSGEQTYKRESPKKVRDRWQSEKSDIRLASRWDRDAVGNLLQRRHSILDNCLESFRAIGYVPLTFSYTLLTPLVIGLGNEHPTEKGFRFDWSLGIPVIPASSIKGVVRLAYLINCLNELPTEEEAQAFAGFLLSGKLPELGQRFFGVGADQEARRGKVIFLDAYPASLPRLKAEIMNCHYPDYYKGDRGPTEDQSPNPQKFWAVATKGSDGQPLQFIFRLLVHNSLANEASYLETLKKALDAALRDHGLGAKTAIGHGRFGLAGTDAAPQGELASSSSGSQPSPKPPPKQASQETWPRANLTWRAQDGTVSATYQGKTASAKGKEIIPENLVNRLCAKKPKPATAQVTVELIGGKNYRLMKIHEPS